MAGLGESLQNTRHMRGVSLEEAERATHISRRYLQALEDEDFSVFVAPVFARGFLRNYSQYLGLDPEEMLSYWPQSPAAAAAAPEPESTRDDIEYRRGRVQDRTPPRRVAVTRGTEPPSPLSRPNLAPAEHTPGSRVLAVAAGLVVCMGVIAFVAGKAAGRSASSPVRSGGAAAPTPGGASRTPGAAQPRLTPTPPSRSAGAMPVLVGQDAQSAIQQLQQRGVTPLVVSVTSPNRADRPGTVIRQEPSAGTGITTNSGVTLVVDQAAPAPGAPAISTPPRVPAFGTPSGTRTATAPAR